MKKKISLLALALMSAILVFTGCNQQEEEPKPADGAIVVENKSGILAYVTLAAVNPYLSNDGQTVFDNAKRIKNKAIKKEQSVVFDFNYSDFRYEGNDQRNFVSIWVSKDNNSHGMFYFNRLEFFGIETHVIIDKDDHGNLYAYRDGSSEYTDFVPLHDESETPDKTISFHNNCDFNIYAGLWAIEDNTLDYPKAITKRYLVKAGESIDLPYFSSDLDLYEYVGLNYWRENAFQNNYRNNTYFYWDWFCGNNYEEFNDFTVSIVEKNDGSYYNIEKKMK